MVLIFFIRLTDNGEEERKIHDLALEKLQRARDEWSNDRMKRLAWKKWGKGNAMLGYYRVFAKQIKTLLPEPQLSDFCYPSGAEKMVNSFFLQWEQVLQHIAYTSTWNKMTGEEKLYQAYYQPDRFWTDGKAIKELHKIMSTKITYKKHQVLPWTPRL